MTSNDYLDKLRETISFVMSRWRLIILPLLVVAPLAYITVKLSPTQYTATSVLLLRPSQVVGFAAGGQVPQQNAADQIKAIESWLKSDPVLEEYLPLITDTPIPKDPYKLAALLKETRSSLKLTLVNNAVLEVTLDGSSPQGLGRKLEVVLTRLMEGLLKPGDGLMSGSQLIKANRFEAARRAEIVLFEALKNEGIEPSPSVMKQLEELETDGTASLQKPASINNEKAEDALALAIAKNPRALQKLRDLYVQSVSAKAAYESATSLFPSDSRYLGLFESPERLTIIGRPRDPLIGEQPARKIAMAAIIFSILMGIALAYAADLLAPRLRTPDQYEQLTGLPVIVRLPRL